MILSFQGTQSTLHTSLIYACHISVLLYQGQDGQTSSLKIRRRAHKEGKWVVQGHSESVAGQDPWLRSPIPHCPSPCQGCPQLRMSPTCPKINLNKYSFQSWKLTHTFKVYSVSLCRWGKWVSGKAYLTWTQSLVFLALDLIILFTTKMVDPGTSHMMAWNHPGPRHEPHCLEI